MCSVSGLASPSRDRKGKGTEISDLPQRRGSLLPRTHRRGPERAQPSRLLHEARPPGSQLCPHPVNTGPLLCQPFTVPGRLTRGRQILPTPQGKASSITGAPYSSRLCVLVTEQSLGVPSVHEMEPRFRVIDSEA